MLVIKRDGRTVDFDRAKIEIAIRKANAEVAEHERATDAEIESILSYIESKKCVRKMVEDIHDIIEQKLLECGHFELAKT